MEKWSKDNPLKAGIISSLLAACIFSCQWTQIRNMDYSALASGISVLLICSVIIWLVRNDRDEIKSKTKRLIDEMGLPTYGEGRQNWPEEGFIINAKSPSQSTIDFIRLFDSKEKNKTDGGTYVDGENFINGDTFNA